MKKLVILSQSDIEYVQEIAKSVSSPQAKTGNFSKGLRQIIKDHKGGKNGT